MSAIKYPVELFNQVSEKISLSMEQVEYLTSYGDWREIKFYDDGYGKLFVFGYEYGAPMIIKANSLDDAYGIFLDESPTIEEDELHGAYGILDALKELPSFNWFDGTGEFEQTYSLTQKLIDFYFNDQRNSWCDTQNWVNSIGVEFPEFSQNQVEELADYLSNLPEHGWELIEGYEYQPNASDTGIVSVGHYLWYRELNEDYLNNNEQYRITATID